MEPQLELIKCFRYQKYPKEMIVSGRSKQQSQPMTCQYLFKVILKGTVHPVCSKTQWKVTNIHPSVELHNANVSRSRGKQRGG